MRKFLLTLILLLSCAIQAKLNISFDKLTTLPKKLDGKTKKDVTITINEYDIENHQNWQKDLTKTIQSIDRTLINLTLNLPESVTKIGNDFLENCTSLTSFELPDSIIQINDWFLSGCTGLTSFELPKSVKYIGWDFLKDCTRLTSFELPDSVIKIDSGFLSGCTSLTFFKLTSSLTKVPDYFLYGLKNANIQLILDRADGIYFKNPNEVSNMTEDQKRNCLKTKGTNRIKLNNKGITPEDLYEKGFIINFTVPDTCTLCLLSKKYPKKALH
jgi:hypothetical protein